MKQASGQGYKLQVSTVSALHRSCRRMESWTETDCPKRVLRLPRQYSLHTISFRGQGQGQVRSGQVTKKQNIEKGMCDTCFMGHFTHGIQ